MVIAAIVAGGMGSRMGTNIPKQFLRLGSRRILLWSVETFLHHPQVDTVVVGVPREWLAYAGALFDEQIPGERRRRVLLTEGGANRNETLWRITEVVMARCKAPRDTVLLTHDAVRPFVTEKMITDNIEALQKAGAGCAVTTAIPSVDTVLRLNENGTVRDVPPRSRMWLAQTPQTVFLGDWRALYAGMTLEEREMRTDVSGCYHAAGKRVFTVQGDRGNVKITTPEDYDAAVARVGKAKEGKTNV